MENNVNHTVFESLTERELQVLRRLSRGMSNHEIARDLVLSPGTVKWYNKQIYRKLGVHSRAKAVTEGRRAGLFDAEPEPTSTEELSPDHNLPAQLTPFVGRKKDLEAISTLLADPSIRLVNIQGPGGIGKTRLAIEAAREHMGVFADGIYFVPLAAFDDPELISTPIASAAGYSFHSRVQSDTGDASHQNQELLDYLQERNVLLVLDNIEHLLDGTQFLVSILQAAGGVKLITTSRERLNLQAETVYSLGRMYVPEKTDQLSPVNAEHEDALLLFVDCAKRSQPGFELNNENINEVIEICRLVDGYPLGIELAAAWTSLLAPREIAAEIRTSLDFLVSDLQDLPDRQRSIRLVFESSWKRFNGDEKRVFRRLSVFRGGFTRGAAESVAGATLPLLMALVNKSLVKPDYSGRYNIHELLRQFGLEKLEAAGETSPTRDRHLAFFLQLAEETELKVQGTDQVRWLNELDLENDNFRASLEWGRTAKGRAETGLLLAGALEHFWSIRGYFSEGRRNLKAAINLPGAQVRNAARAKALEAAGHLAYLQSDYPDTRRVLEESISIYRELGDSGRKGLANTLITLGDMYSELAEYETADALFDEALAIMHELDDIRGIARAYWQMGQCAVRPGDYERAAEYFHKALPLLRQVDDRSYTSIALSGLAEIAIRQGDFDRANKLEEESLELRCEINETWGIAVSLANFGWIALCKDELEEARRLIGESMELRREIGDVGGIAWCLEKLAEISLIEGKKISDLSGQTIIRRAACLFGAAAGLRDPINSAIDTVDLPHYEAQVAQIRDVLGEEIFDGMWAEGAAMSLDQAVAYALEGVGE